MTARTLAIARVIFGGSILYFWLVANVPDALGAVAAHGPHHHFIKLVDQTGLLTALSGSAIARGLIYWSVAVLLVAFMAGLLTRIVYPACVALFWLAALMQNAGHHMTPLLLALLVTLPAPWGERWSLDSLFRRRSREPVVANPFYGYPIWLLGLTIGITYTTSGLTKIVITEGRWLWETGARNGFMQDFNLAATDWGMVVANSYVLALAASVLAAFGQGVYVCSCFTRRTLVKYAIAFGIAIPFIIGLVLFMGLMWWWWIILIPMLYLPWVSIDRLVARDRRVTERFDGSARLNWHRRWFLGATGFLIGLHAFALVTRTEYEPLYSNYPMYAQGMQAGSANEAAFWSNYKTADRHFQVAIQVVGTGGSVSELGPRYHLAWNLERLGLWRLEVAKLNPFIVLQDAKAEKPIKPESCATIRSVANSYDPGGTPTAIRFARRYIDVVEGQMAWVPIASWVEVDLVGPGCAYRTIEG